ncbi:LysE family translocator [Staphylococcus arlettae]|uniref:Amino acid transporter LysE n=1 Tax=Staphylococcus arlettae TaxID=29378 RepID=A0ABQ0XR03_9STAP|nr:MULTISPECIES: LysE family translocator [Staphylococcus]KAB2478870.1 LysE family translocator [Staphylococcus sp. CH99b_3]MCD8834114.1 LysE family translocator [Staphylococcus arlettae]MCD8887955.1 LysE family translocator [Staphylococcus arlettae]MEB5898958.1 LysE family translocator [Staphylococcus arlettae]PNZ52867.1 lysine transporter LysE [Staphylococcus arlettae]
MEGLLTFITITLMIIIVPGPDFFIVMKNSISSGRVNGTMAALGITSGHVIYSLLAIFGIIFILAQMYYVFLVIKILGACYLIYLGIRSIISARQGLNFTPETMKIAQVSYLNSYRQGIVSTLLNPKALLYYISILPQFLSTGGAVTSQIAILSAIVTSVILIWFIFCVFIFQYIKKLFANRKIKAFFDYAVGFILVGLSINLLLSKAN